jgi:hypothetical protein
MTGDVVAARNRLMAGVETGGAGGFGFELPGRLAGLALLWASAAPVLVADVLLEVSPLADLAF